MSSLPRLLLALALGAFVPGAAAQTRLVVKFGSVCCGIDSGAYEDVRALVREREAAAGFKLPARILHWGKEGEVTLCYALRRLRPSDQVRLINEIRAVKAERGEMKVEENAPCAERW